jgi:hypothetical protein
MSAGGGTDKLLPLFLLHPKRFNEVEVVSNVTALLLVTANELTLLLAGLTKAFTPEEAIIMTARRVL